MTINWIVPCRGASRGNTGHFREGVAGTLTAGKDGRMQMSIAVRQDVMKAMRWVIGDRVLVGYDSAQGTIVMRRDQRGHKLTRPGQKASVGEGQPFSAVVKITLRGGIPESAFPFFVPLSNCVIDGIDLHFQPQKDAA